STHARRENSSSFAIIFIASAPIFPLGPLTTMLIIIFLLLYFRPAIFVSRFKFVHRLVKSLCQINIQRIGKTGKDKKDIADFFFYRLLFFCRLFRFFSIIMVYLPG